MRRIGFAVAVAVLLLPVAQAQRKVPMPRRASPTTRPARATAQTMSRATRCIVPFTLTTAKPSFTYQFVPPADGTYTAAANWQSRAQLKVAVAVTGRSTPLASSGRAPVGVAFTASKGRSCAVTVKPASGAVATRGELAILTGSGHSACKRMPPGAHAMATGVARIKSKSAFLPILARLARRHLANSRNKNELDIAFEQALSRHPGVTDQLLGDLVQDYKRLPAGLRASKLVEPGGDGLAPLTKSACKTALLAAGPSFSPVTVASPTALVATMKMPWITQVQPAPSAKGYRQAQAIAIMGRNFATSPVKTKVELHWADDEPPVGPDYHCAMVTSHATTTLQYAIPETASPGPWKLNVFTRDGGYSNSVPIAIYAGYAHIERVEPEAPTQGYSTGQAITLHGWGFNAPPATTKVEFRWSFGEKNPPANKRYYYVHAAAQSTARLAVSLPIHLQSGNWTVNVSTKDLGQSNLYAIPVKQQPQSAPVITGIVPGAVGPGQQVQINGRNFKPGRVHRVWWRRAGGQGTWYSDRQTATSTRLTCLVPGWAKPGEYSVEVKVLGWPAHSSNQRTCRVKAPKYKLTFDRLKCVDESNPEWWGNDEIATFWVIAADEQVWEKNTGEYGGFDDGDEKAYKPNDRTAYMVDGTYGPISDYLVVVTELYEWDVGSVSAAQDVLGFISDFGSVAVGALFGPDMGYTLKAIAEAISEVIGTVVSWFGGDPDYLGTHELSWTYSQLQSILEPGQSLHGELYFKNGGSTGSYRVYYTLRRQ